MPAKAIGPQVSNASTRQVPSAAGTERSMIDEARRSPLFNTATRSDLSSFSNNRSVSSRQRVGFSASIVRKMVDAV